MVKQKQIISWAIVGAFTAFLFDMIGTFSPEPMSGLWAAGGFLGYLIVGGIAGIIASFIYNKFGFAVM